MRKSQSKIVSAKIAKIIVSKINESQNIPQILHHKTTKNLLNVVCILGPSKINQTNKSMNKFIFIKITNTVLRCSKYAVPKIVALCSEMYEYECYG